MPSPEADSSAQSANDLASGTTAWQPSIDNGTSTLLETEPFPAASWQLGPRRQPGEGTLFAQLLSWLALRGFNVSSSVPAAFEVDEKRRRQRFDDGPKYGDSASSRHLSSSSTVVELGPDAHRHDHGTPYQQVPDVNSQSIAGDISSHRTQYFCGLRQDVFQNLLESARQMLANNSYSDKSAPSRPSTEEATDDFRTAGTTYTLQDEDVLCIITHVVQVLEALHHASILSLHGRDRPNRATERESTTVSKAILPQAAKEADTATTITLPQTYITPIGPAEQPLASDTRPVAYEEITTTTTLVSHSTVTSKTEINWITSNRVSSSPDHGNAAPHEFSGSRLRSVGYHGDTIDTCGGERHIRARVDSVTSPPEHISASRRASAAETASRAHVDSYPSANPSVGSSECSIVSFPALRVRHCTNDWLSPPAATPGVKDHSDKNLYSVGIDAHTGSSGFVSPNSSIDMSSAAPGFSPGDLAFTLPAFERGHDPVPDDNTHRLGASIGTSAGRKRSHHAVVSADVRGPRSSVLQKLREGSVQFGQALASAVGGSTGHAQQQQADQGRRVSGMDRMKAILDRTAAQQGQVNTAGHTQVGTASREVVARRRRCDTCSEDGRPHMCADDGISSDGSK
ncbi:hypothetical protein CONLIGDRAFT_648876 [Coniochaeta ligniaria NRRL 30616]|uniref:Uncharacterized protein n=1 Tax=Coniochaeta ligniaria NRRL 30616 TaxID=1408157 RepID=A0A1J7J4J6_9PEZI|nr:hypothetical protein CONLIGDRAFT_648876 [Coniochaeta ligniaria NRRL 30616]